MTLKKLRQRASLAVGVVTAALVVPGLAALPAQAAGEAAAAPASLPQTVSADALPTVQINGVVWNQLVVGNTVYVTGQFTSARPAGSPAGQNEVSRSNLLAYDIRTGNLITSWAPTLNGPGYALAASADGRKIYVGGQFTTANGAATNRLVALDATSGAVVSGFRPRFDARVRSIAVVGNTVYAGGIFTSVGGTARTRLAAVDGTTGALLPWNATADAEVMAMVVPSSVPELVIAGRFTTVNGASSQGTAALDLSSGASLPWALPARVRSGSKDSAVYSLSTDGTGVYGTAYDFDRAGNFENSFAAEADGGTFRWVNSCLGDTYANYPLGGVLYTAGHTHDCSSMDGIPEMSPRGYQHANAETTAVAGVNRQNAYGWAGGDPAPALLHWQPTFTAGTFTGQSQAAWSIAGNSQYIVYGGEFPTVNGVGQQGLVRFAVRSAAPGKEGPQGAGDLTPSATTTYPGTVRLSWKAAWDRDDATLTYELLRGPAAAPVVVATTTATSQWWDRPAVSVSDPSAPSGSQTYRVRVTDPSGNSVTGSATTVTVPAADRVNAYADAVKADGASDYWRLGEPRGAVGVSSLGTDDLLLDASEQRGQAGALPDGDPATGFTGVTSVPLEGVKFGANYRAVVPATTTVARPGPSTYSTEVWFKTTTTTGGKLIGFGNNPKDLSGNYDRHVYMTDDGRLVAGANGNGIRTAASSKSYNDGQWHQAVATLGGNGLALYVDGALVARDSGARGGQAFDGYWKVGGDNTAWWPSAPTSNGFAGTIDDVSVYPAELTRAQVAAHYTASGRTPVGVAAPADAYGKAVFTSDPQGFWRLQETSGTALADSGPDGLNPAAVNGSAQLGAPGTPGIAGSTGITVGGAQGDGFASTAAQPAPSTYSEELWFSTTSTRGGKLIGFGSSKDGYSGSYDRHVWMDRDGTLHFGTWTGRENRVDTTKSYNDGKWHHLVATQGASGMALYLDGALVGTNPETGAQGYDGFWRVGGDSSWGSTENGFFDGTLDDVAVYGRALTAQDVAAHYRAAGGNTAPTATFTATATGRSVAVDASASTDADGTVASYAWAFGDGGTATGATATHDYAAPGSYTVVLTATDDKGATSTAEKVVVVRSAAATAPADAYGAAVYAAGPDSYYRLDEAAGATAAADSSGLGNAGTIRAGVTTGAPGAPAGAGTGATFDGSVGAVVIDPRRAAAPTTYSTELWFSTTSTRGGKLVGFGDGDGSGYSGAYDRHVIMNPDGSLHFGTWTGQENRVDTAGGYNDGRWHHLVATQGPAGMALYVDGKSVGTNPQTAAQGYTGSWRVGGDSGWGPLQNGFFDGSIDEVAFYSKVLGASTVADHYAKGSAAAPANQAPTAAFTSTATALAASFDASTSADADGTVAGYAWTFGDGATGTGATASHTYAAAGTYQVTLVVTDDKGATGTVTKAVEVTAGTTPPPTPTNQAPTAAFTAAAKDLAVSVDGSTSADADGTVASYAWTFGDQGTATGKTATHTYAAAGTYKVTLTVTDDKGATSSKSDDVVVTAPVVANQAPTASFTSSVKDLAVGVDASASADADGTVASYAWDFGDRVTATGRTASHTYAAAGTYPVTLVVTDDKGATSSVTRDVVVTAPAPVVSALAADAFGRTATGGWGTADTGGAWTPASGASSFSVAPGAGRVVLAAAGQTRAISLNGVSSADTDLQATFALDKAATGGGTYLTLQGRRVGGDDYRTTARVLADGSVSLSLQKVVGGTASTLRTVTVPNLKVGAGQQVTVRLQVQGTGTTALNAKAWATGTAEPTAWALTGTDTGASLQAAGSIGVVTYLSGSSTGAPTTVSVSGLKAAKI